MMRVRIAGLFLAIAASQPLAAQATGLPTFYAPRRAFGSSELGVTLSRPGGNAIALEGRVGARLERADINFRAGFVDPGGNGDASVLIGVEARIPVLGHSSTFPLDGSFIVGAGHRFDPGGGQTFVPLGLSLGRRLLLDGTALQLTPYLQPTMILIDDPFFAMGLGLDLKIRGIPEIRFNSSVGDMEGHSIGLFWAR
jgi:hypothetical protein